MDIGGIEMAIQKIDINMEFKRSVGDVFAYLSNHDNLGPIFGCRVIRTHEGKDSPNGLDSVRTLNVGLLPSFDETVTAFEKDQLIEYKITRGSPLRNHKGVMRFLPSGPAGSKLHYTIEFESKIPLVGPLIRMRLENSIRNGLKILQE